MALGADRDTPQLADVKSFNFPVKGNVKIYAGALVALVGGVIAPGSEATTLKACFRAEEQVDNTGGSDGDKRINVRRGCYRYNNSASTDLIALTEVGTNCYVVDDQTVAKTSNTNARSVAGVVRDVDAKGVWVEL